jgi:hypothetical protein
VTVHVTNLIHPGVSAALLAVALWLPAAAAPALALMFAAKFHAPNP